jgi:hypothetical protein
MTKDEWIQQAKDLLTDCSKLIEGTELSNDILDLLEEIVKG